MRKTVAKNWKKNPHSLLYASTKTMFNLIAPIHSLISLIFHSYNDFLGWSYFADRIKRNTTIARHYAMILQNNNKTLALKTKQNGRGE